MSITLQEVRLELEDITITISDATVSDLEFDLPMISRFEDMRLTVAGVIVPVEHDTARWIAAAYENALLAKALEAVERERIKAEEAAYI